MTLSLRDVLSLSAVALALLIVTVMFFVGLRLVWRSCRWAIQNAGIFGSSPSVRLLALGIVAGCSTRTIQELIVIPLHSLYLLASGVFDAIAQLVAYPNWDSPNAAGAASQPVLIALAKVFRSAAEDIFRAPIANILRLFAWWVFVGQLLNAPALIVQPASSSRPWFTHIPNWLSRVSVKNWQNIALAILLSFGSYVAISALVMVPWLREGASIEALNVERLDQRLLQVRTSLDSERVYAENRYSSSPLSGLDDLLRSLQQAAGFASPATLDAATAPSTLPATAPTTAPSESVKKIVPPPIDTPQVVTIETWRRLADGLQGPLSIARDLRIRGISAWTAARTAALNQRETLRERAREAYGRTIADSMSPSERASHFEATVQWYRENLQANERALGNLMRDLDRQEDVMRVLAGEVDRDYRDLLARMRTAETGESAQAIADRFYPRFDVNYSLRFIREPFVENPQASPLPAAPKAGGSWGIFGAISSWLLRTQSPSLALIAGMIGFGVLGAAASTIVRERRLQQSTAGVMVNDVSGVAIRGVSAAIVVYLVVVTGLGAVSTSAANPDPHALFLICLIGAVFSEVIWRWAQGFIESQFPGGKKTGDRQEADEPDKSPKDAPKVN